MMVRVTEVAPADEARIIEILCEAIDLTRDHITSEASWQRLEQFFYEALLGRRTLSAAVVLAWADVGHPAADRAVRRYGAEVLDQYREGELLAQMRGQLVKILLRPFVPFPQGRHVVANMMRDLWLPWFMTRAAEALQLPVTRSRSTAAPSLAYFLSKALRKRGVALSEPRLNKLYWRREKLAAELEASMPPIPVSILPAA
jgi:hypothetical protein